MSAQDAGSAEQFRKVDLHYVKLTAQAAKQAGAQQFSLCTVKGANASVWANDLSPFHALLYMKTKGQVGPADPSHIYLLEGKQQEIAAHTTMILPTTRSRCAKLSSLYPHEKMQAPDIACDHMQQLSIKLLLSNLPVFTVNSTDAHDPPLHDM